MKLYYHPISTYSQKVLVALYEKNIEFESELVMLMDPDARERYRQVYPLGKIPALVLDDGRLIPESTIIIEYLDTLGGPALVSGNADEQRQIRFKDRMLDLYLNDNVATLLFQGMKAAEDRDTARIEQARFQIETLYGFMDKELGEQAFIAGETFSMADCAAAAPLLYAQQIAPYDEHPNICAYFDRLSSRDSVQRTQEEAMPALQAFMSQDAA